MAAFVRVVPTMVDAITRETRTNTPPVVTQETRRGRTPVCNKSSLYNDAFYSLQYMYQGLY